MQIPDDTRQKKQKKPSDWLLEITRRSKCCEYVTGYVINIQCCTQALQLNFPPLLEEEPSQKCTKPMENIYFFF